MVSVLVFLVALVGFLGWLAYVAYRDPAGIFRPRPRDDGADQAAGRPDHDDRRPDA